MSKSKRFEFYSDEDLIGVLDTVTGKTFNSFEIVDLLNVMNDTLITQARENHKLSNKNIEQQATIRRLQDLCGESDGENMKLRIENKQLRQKLDFYLLDEFEWKEKYGD